MSNVFEDIDKMRFTPPMSKEELQARLSAKRINIKVQKTNKIKALKNKNIKIKLRKGLPFKTPSQQTVVVQEIRRVQSPLSIGNPYIKRNNRQRYL